MREERKNELLLSFHPWQDQAHHLPEQSTLQTVPPLGLAGQVTIPQQHHHRSNRTIPETAEPSAPAPVSEDALCQNCLHSGSVPQIGQWGSSLDVAGKTTRSGSRTAMTPPHLTCTERRSTTNRLLLCLPQFPIPRA